VKILYLIPHHISDDVYWGRGETSGLWPGLGTTSKSPAWCACELSWKILQGKVSISDDIWQRYHNMNSGDAIIYFNQASFRAWIS